MVSGMKLMGVGLANAAKHKLVGLLSERLKSDGVYVGEVMVGGAVKGTAWAAGGDGIDPSTIAEAFWTLYQQAARPARRSPDDRQPRQCPRLGRRRPGCGLSAGSS